MEAKVEQLRDEITEISNNLVQAEQCINDQDENLKDYLDQSRQIVHKARALLAHIEVAQMIGEEFAPARIAVVELSELVFDPMWNSTQAMSAIVSYARPGSHTEL